MNNIASILTGVIVAVAFGISTSLASEEAEGCGHAREGVSCLGEGFAFGVGKLLFLPSPTDRNPDDRACMGYPFGAEKKEQVQVCHYVVQMRDGFALRGYKFEARGTPTRRGKSFVLVGQGNAMIAEQVLNELEYLTRSGLDGFVFDFRGYGRNKKGKSRVGTIMADFADVLRHLEQDYQYRTVYGVSFGGVAALHALAAGIELDVLVLDSVPSCIQIVKCPLAFEPLHNVQRTSARLHFIGGNKDSNEFDRLARAIEGVGGELHISDEFTHMFQDKEQSVRFCRIQLVRALLNQDHYEPVQQCISRLRADEGE